MKALMWLLIACMLVAACSDQEPMPQTGVENVPSQILSAQEAQKNLEKIYPDFYPTTRGGAMPQIASCTSYSANRQPTTRADQEPLYYVFNFEDNQGFAIMSASRQKPDVLAISDKGNLDLSNTLPDNGIEDFVQRLDTYMTQSTGDSAVLSDDEFYTWYNDWTTTKAVGPLCKVKWHQLPPYNEVINDASNGQIYYAGCG